MVVSTVFDELAAWLGDTPKLLAHYRDEHQSELARFLEVVERGAPAATPELATDFAAFLSQISPDPRELRWAECWEWQGDRLDGYGIFRQGPAFYHAHRLAVCLAKGTSFVQLQEHCRAERKEVCHTCENRACVNPHHLLLATHSHNVRTAVRSGRLQPPPDRHRAARRYQHYCWIVWEAHVVRGESLEGLAALYQIDPALLERMAREAHQQFGAGQRFPG